MSWFKRTPRAKEPQKLVPKEPSPMSEKLLKESKAAMKQQGTK